MPSVKWCNNVSGSVRWWNGYGGEGVGREREREREREIFVCSWGVDMEGWCVGERKMKMEFTNLFSFL